MKKILLINGHQEYPFSEGKLTDTLIEYATDILTAKGYEVMHTATAGTYDTAEEIEKWKEADAVILQFPINWMSVPWSCKKYIDDVMTVGMMGELSDGDGRHHDTPKKGYGTGGKLNGKYMLSVTANAPAEAFNDPAEPFFAGISEDDLFNHIHLCFKWCGLESLPTFIAYDVMKNPTIAEDLHRFKEHIEKNFPDAK